MKKLALAVIAVLALTSCGTSKPAAPKPPENITIAFGGDTHGVDQISRFLNSGGDPFKYVKNTLTNADISVVNLESAVTTLNEHQDKKYVFNTNPYLLDWMKTDGIDIVNIGNNHAGDFLREGVTETIKNLTDRGLKVIGAGNSGREAWTAKVVDVRGTKIAFLGIAKINGGAGTVASGAYAGTTDGWDNQVIELAIKAAARQAKAVIIYTHWGVEEQTCPEKSDVAAAQKWLEWGATAIIGSHPHRQQPYVLENGKLIDYSLGNFVFYSGSAGAVNSGVGLLTLAPTGEVLKYQFKPALINPLNGSVKFLNGEAAKKAIAAKQSKCVALGN
ncbi:MAG: CapA family protein [Actinomycetales bacterium]|nr:CapA family protein [Actinomycetales bacterium]